MKRAFGWAADPWEKDHAPSEFAMGMGAGALPASASHEACIGNVYDQLITESCVGQSLAKATAITLRVRGHKVPSEPSPQWIWNMTRLSTGMLAKNVGVYPSDALEVVQQLGYPTVKQYPFDVSKITDKPDEEVARNAFDQRTVTGYRVIKQTGSARVREIKAALAQGYALVYGQAVDEAFCEFTGKGVLGRPRGDIVGRHMQTIVGYDGDRFRVLNSWGTGWGDGGLWWANSEVMTWNDSTDFISVQVCDPPSS